MKLTGGAQASAGGRGEERVRARLGPELGHGGRGAAGSARAGNGGKGEGVGLLWWAERERGERLSPSGFIHFHFLFFSRSNMHMFK